MSYDLPVDTPRSRPRANKKVGRRQARINRLLEPLSFSSNPDEWRAAAAPNNVPAYPDRLKRGYRVKRNDDCYCGSGKKFKHCHKQLEKETPRWDFYDKQKLVYNPYENKWVSVPDLDKYLKDKGV